MRNTAAVEHVIHRMDPLVSVHLVLTVVWRVSTSLLAFPIPAVELVLLIVWETMCVVGYIFFFVVLWIVSRVCE